MDQAILHVRMLNPRAGRKYRDSGRETRQGRLPPAMEERSPASHDGPLTRNATLAFQTTGGGQGCHHPLRPRWRRYVHADGRDAVVRRGQDEELCSRVPRGHHRSAGLQRHVRALRPMYSDVFLQKSGTSLRYALPRCIVRRPRSFPPNSETCKVKLPSRRRRPGSSSQHVVPSRRGQSLCDINLPAHADGSFEP